MAKVVRIETINGKEVRRTMDMQDSIWQTIVRGAPLPKGVTYEPAPKLLVKTVELMPNGDDVNSVMLNSETIQEEPVIEKRGPGRKAFKK